MVPLWLAAGWRPSTGAEVPLPAGVHEATSVEGVTEYRLANGLRVLLIPDASVDTVTVNVTYLVGSRHEGYGEAGMAHLLEHMLFRGTPSRPGIWAELKKIGASANGTTSFDRTNYFETFPASESNLDAALGLEADRMLNSFVSRKDLDAEMTVVRNEFESGENSPFGVLRQRVAATAYLWHAYGRSVIGSRSDIETPIERLQATSQLLPARQCSAHRCGQVRQAKALQWWQNFEGSGNLEGARRPIRSAPPRMASAL
jgi:zinc protease